jgi:two-component system, OmpR family, response regulator VanR
MKIPITEEKSLTRTSNIIMVDDERDANLTIKTALEDNRDFKVDTFNDADSALMAFKPNHYDLAILDVRMPGTNGFQLCRKLGEIDKKLKISFLSASDLTNIQDIDLDIINEFGADRFIVKPIKTADLINSLKVMISPA